MRATAPMDVATDQLIRDVTEDDAEAVQKIYAHHVLHGTASYDYEPPSVEDTLAKIRRIMAPGWPFLVAARGDDVAGYCYATQFRDREGYRFTCENSIYVHPNWLGRGVGKQLLKALLPRASACGFRTMIAVIGGAEPASIGVHASCGFEEVGRLRAVGFKHGRWLDNVYMQRSLMDQE
ncbi:GNAT family N-acetyltransferase [Sphingomonas limnosediminicola]|uniref:GNAT family N-acetyltransferase n=2 Tax=Sphingomonas limnosediminicola TaxID=940133 RepID=A0ABP7KTY3_9SPHN